MTKCFAARARATALLVLGWWSLVAAPAWAQSTAPAAAAETATSETIDRPTAENGAEAAQADPPKTHLLKVNGKLLQLAVPVAWKAVEPRNRLIEVELAILPHADGEDAAEAADTADEDAPRGRLTMMAAGGDVDANIRRWVGQFRLGRDADGKDAMHRDERKLRGAIAHVLDIAGTYFDSPEGPLGPKVERADYRMLGAIIEIDGAGKYFVKFYGPADIVEENREAFEEMLATLEVLEPEPEESTATKEGAEPATKSAEAES